MILHEELASVGQRMLWMIERYRGGSGRLNYPLALRLRGPLDGDRLGEAVDQLVARHEALRTTFGRRNGLLTQLVHAPEPVPILAVRLDADPDPRSRLADEMRREATTSVDPTVSPLRVTLWKVGAQEHVLCLNAHHLATDAWSSRVITDELVGLLAGAAPPAKVAWQYRHFARWQHRRTTAEQWRGDEAYWRARLAGVTAAGPLNGGRVLPPDPGGASISLDLDGAVAGRIANLAKAQRATPFMVLLAWFYLALHGDNGQSDLCVAAPFANRVRPECAGTVGLFANLVMLRTHVGDGTFADVLGRTRETVNDAMAHQGFPYYMLSADAGSTRQDRLDDVVFQMLPELPSPVAAGELDVEVLAPELHSRFDLELAAIPHAHGLRVRLQYAHQRVADEVARRLADRYSVAVAQTFAGN